MVEPAGKQDFLDKIIELAKVLDDLPLRADGKVRWAKSSARRR